MIDINQIRNDFPILARQVNGHRLVYLDNAATSQKPLPVIDALVDYYQNYNANVHRGIHTLADESTKIYNSARDAVADFIGAGDRREIVFVRNTTEAINLIAYSWGRASIKAGDEILLTQMEHHSNIVPWQMLADEKKAVVKYVSVTPAGKLDLDDLKNKLSSRTKLVSVVHVSNFLGTINPIKEISQIIKRSNLFAKRLDLERPLLLVDGAQAVPHMPVNVQELGGDFYAFSGHKMYGPMGIGCLWGRREILESMPPFLTGGGMIRVVDIASGTTFTDLPDKFEAGTPNVAGAVGLAAAVKYLQRVGMKAVREHELGLTEYALEKLKVKSQKLKVNIIGPKAAEQRGGLVAFTVAVNGKEIHGHDVAQILDGEGIALRSGHHCTMPMHTNLGLAATTRVSFGIYNTKEDVDRFVSALKRVPETFS